MKVLITGAAGFIGFSLASFLLKKKFNVTGIDNLDNYYSVKLKKKRLEILKKYKNFKFIKLNISSNTQIKKIEKEKFSFVFHFAAQPGVRYSLINPKKYYESNIIGYENLIESLDKTKLKKVFYSSSSSVYGDQKKYPTKEINNLNAKNPYAISKIINEKLSEFYSNLYGIPFIGLRFFTVYGEWGRPDMFIIKFLNCIYKNKIFYLNNNGNHFRDFTYVSDIVRCCYKLISYKSKSKHLVFNICAGQQINIKKLTNKILRIFPNAKLKSISANKADVYKTHGNNKFIVKELNISNFSNINIGLTKTINWFKKEKIHKYL